MTRQLDREAAAATLAALSIFQTVYDHPARTFEGRSPVASVVSRGLVVEGATRGGGANLAGSLLAVSIYVRADPGAEAAAEDSLDTITEAAALALADARWTVEGVDALPDGAPLRNVDGALYRVERILISR